MVGLVADVQLGQTCVRWDKVVVVTVVAEV